MMMNNVFIKVIPFLVARVNNFHFNIIVYLNSEKAAQSCLWLKIVCNKYIVKNIQTDYSITVME